MDLAPASVTLVENSFPFAALIVAGVVFVLVLVVLWWYMNRMRPRRSR